MVVKRNGMNTVSVFLACLLLILLLSSCFYSPRYKNSVYYNGRNDLLVLFTYTIPFVPDLSVKMKGDVEIYPVETDEFGRTLGIIQFNSVESNPLFGENAVYCILQSGSKDSSSFYEDVCCVMVENDVDPAEAIEQLKLDNDWNLPLAMNNCRTIPIENSSAVGVYNTNYGYTNYLAIACEAVGWSVDSAWIEVLCKDGCGLWLFTLVRDKHKEDSPACLIMMKEAPSDDPMLSIVGTRPIDNRSSPWEEIHAFKKGMGWQFES